MGLKESNQTKKKIKTYPRCILYMYLLYLNGKLAVLDHLCIEMILLTLFQDESSVNLFAGGEQEISSTDPDLLKWIQKRIENLMKYKQR